MSLATLSRACLSLAVTVAGCATFPPAQPKATGSMPEIDGIALDVRVTPNQLQAPLQGFSCVKQDPTARFQICSQDFRVPKATIVFVLDSRVGAIIRVFDHEQTDAAAKWSISLMGEPTHRSLSNGRTDLLWDEKGAPFARLLTHLKELDGESAFLIMTRTLEQYLDEISDTMEGLPERPSTQKGMTPARCLALPLLCPAA